MISVQKNIALNDLTTIRCGGFAKHFVEARSEDEVIQALEYAENHGLRIFILGGGSNSLIADHGFDGLVIRMLNRRMSVNQNGTIIAQAGVIWDKLVAECCQQGLVGVEALSGIPGSVGATPIQNVGAYGQEVSQTIHSVRAIHQRSRSSRVFSTEECNFSYRNSYFKSQNDDQWLITEVIFKLNPSANPEPSYEELRRNLSKNPRWANGNRLEKIMALRDQVLAIRASKGMVLNPQDPDTHSLGSFFVNPILTTVEKDRICSIAHQSGQTPPIHHIGDNLWKLSAAWLIENSGISRGFMRGGARVSTKHVLAITNPGAATTAEILELAKYIEDSVVNTFGVKLEREPVYVE